MNIPALRCLLIVCLLALCVTSNAVTYGPVTAHVNQVSEWTFTSRKSYAAPFDDLELNVEFTSPNGTKLLVPAFWAGNQTWKVRYASTEPGIHRFVTRCSDSGNQSLNGLIGVIEITPYSGTNIFYQHGPIRIASDKKHFAHADGTPFLWLSDSWYMGLCSRLKFPEEFSILTSDRVSKGFNVVQIVAGFYPDLPAFDPRSANEAGFPWEPDYSCINPRYFDAADKRIQHLVDSGLAPCIFGAWGYYSLFMGEERMQKHWRYLIARYAAYPTFWCLAGEANLPWYLSETPERDRDKQLKIWTQMARYVRKTDPFHRPLSIHPPLDLGRKQVEDPSRIDFEMLQPGHNDRYSLLIFNSLMDHAQTAKPVMPILNAEACYEGILGGCGDEVQRFLVWRGLLLANAGHSYGANGIWQINRRGEPFGVSPNYHNWGNTPWDEAMHLPGSQQVGLAVKILSHYPWWKFESHSEWASLEVHKNGSFTWGDWIWSPDAESAYVVSPGERFFRKRFLVDANQSVTRAMLHIAVDDNAEVYINGTCVGSVVGWNPFGEFDITRLLLPGTNVVAIKAVNIGTTDNAKNPTGLLMNLDLRFKDNSRTQVLSDAGWLCSSNAMPGWLQPQFDDHAWLNSKPLIPAWKGPWRWLGSPDANMPCTAAGIPGKLRFIYLPTKETARVLNLEPETVYRASFVNPQNGEITDLGRIRPDPQHCWTVPERPAASKDWLLILEACEGE